MHLSTPSGGRPRQAEAAPGGARRRLRVGRQSPGRGRGPAGQGGPRFALFLSLCVCACFAVVLRGCGGGATRCWAWQRCSWTRWDADLVYFCVFCALLSAAKCCDCVKWATHSAHAFAAPHWFGVRIAAEHQNSGRRHARMVLRMYPFWHLASCVCACPSCCAAAGGGVAPPCPSSHTPPPAAARHARRAGLLLARRAGAPSTAAGAPRGGGGGREGVAHLTPHFPIYLAGTHHACPASSTAAGEGVCCLVMLLAHTPSPAAGRRTHGGRSLATGQGVHISFTGTRLPCGHLHVSQPCLLVPPQLPGGFLMHVPGCAQHP